MKILADQNCAENEKLTIFYIGEWIYQYGK